MHMDTRGYCSIIKDECPYNYDSCNACNLAEEYNATRERAADKSRLPMPPVKAPKSGIIDNITRIRTMTEDELVNFMYHFESWELNDLIRYCEHREECEEKDYKTDHEECKKCLKKWLHKDASM